MMQEIPYGMIRRSGRIREPERARVSALAESIKEVGLLNPVTVSPSKICEGTGQVDGYRLVAGGHRIEALASLGILNIPCIVVNLEDQQRIIAECDENLCGSRLTPSEVALFTAKRKGAYEALHPETAHGKASPSKDTKLASFAEDQSEKTGESKTTVSRNASRGEDITEGALALVKGTGLDTGVYLDGLKKVDPDRQEDTVRRDLEERRAIKKAKKIVKPDDDAEVVDRQVQSLLNLWNKTSPDARRMFLEQVDEPVMDGRYA